MTDFIDRYERALVDAGTRRRAEKRDQRPWYATRRGTLALIAAVIVAAPATAATTGWDPFADRGGRNPAPTVNTQDPDRSLTTILGVLRRDQTAKDRAAASQRALDRFDTSVGGVHLSDVRVVDAERGVVLVPVDRYGLDVNGPAARRAEGRPSPGSLANAVCLYQPSSDGTAGESCASAKQISDGFALGSSGDVVSGLVPDGVATVRLERGTATATIPVHDNYFVSGPPAPTAPLKATWLDSDGRVLKTIDYAASSPERPATPAAPGDPCAHNSRCVIVTPQGMLAGPEATPADMERAQREYNKRHPNAPLGK